MSASVNSLGILLNFKKLIKVENHSRDVAEEEDADDAYQDRRKVHLFEKMKLCFKKNPGLLSIAKGCQLNLTSFY